MAERPRMTLALALTEVALAVVACRSRNDPERVMELALAQGAGELATPSGLAMQPWSGKPLPRTLLADGAWSIVDLPVANAALGIRTAGGWLVSVLRSSDADHDEYELVSVPDGGTPRALAERFETRPRFLRAGRDVLVGLEDAGGEGPGHLLRFSGAGLEPLDLPLGHVAAAPDRLVVASGWEMSSRTWRLVANGETGPTTLYDGADGERTVGLAVFRGSLVVGVQRLDRSADLPLEERAAAMMEFMAGRPGRAAALAGPAEGYLLTVSLADGSIAREPFPAQRPAAVVVLDDGSLVVIGEGTLAAGLRDGVVVARPPGAFAGWRLLAAGIEMPTKEVTGGRWLCFVEMPEHGQVIHCLSPELGRHLVTPPFEDYAVPWEIVSDAAGARLFFRQSHVSGRDERLLVLPLE
jgi:hypothetical protein